MLGKLMKYELRATARTMLPGFAAVLLLAGLTRLSAAFLMNRHGVLGLLGGIIVFLFVIACMGIGILALVIMIQRFRDSLLGDQGYLTHTLPVTTSQNILAKLLTSVIWYFGTAVCGTLAIVVLAADQQMFSGLYEFARMLLREITPAYAAHGFFWVLELIVLITAALSAFSLVIYASMALGYRSSSRKGLLSALIFFGFNIATQFVGGALTVLLARSNLQLPALSPEASVHAVLLLPALACVLYGLIFWFITSVNLKKHLNLE